MDSIRKNIILSNWHAMRLLSLSIGIFLAVMAVIYEEVLTGLISAFFFFQAITNTGCMVSQSCGVIQKKNPSTNSDKESDIHFTEIK
jgi:hypothetical protein